MKPSPPKVSGDSALAILLFLFCCILAFLDNADGIREAVGAALP